MNEICDTVCITIEYENASPELKLSLLVMLVLFVIVPWIIGVSYLLIGDKGNNG